MPRLDSKWSLGARATQSPLQQNPTFVLFFRWKQTAPCWLLLGAMLACACHGWVLFVDAMVGGLLLGAVVVRDSCRVPGAVGATAAET